MCVICKKMFKSMRDPLLSSFDVKCMGGEALLLFIYFHHVWKVCSLTSPCVYMWRVRLYPNVSLCAYMCVNTVCYDKREK